jgi:Transposase DDE domain
MAGAAVGARVAYAHHILLRGKPGIYNPSGIVLKQIEQALAYYFPYSYATMTGGGRDFVAGAEASGMMGPGTYITRFHIEVVRKADNQVGFAVIARRWVVERFFAWINRSRRLAKDFEKMTESVEAFLYAASSVILLRRLAR